MDIKKLSDGVETLNEGATIFFKAALSEIGEGANPSGVYHSNSRTMYWNHLSDESRMLSQTTQETLLSVIALFIPTLKTSPVLDESDEKDVRSCVKRMRAALKLRKFSAWDIEVIHDEGTILGVIPPRQSEDIGNPQVKLGRNFSNVSSCWKVLHIL